MGVTCRPHTTTKEDPQRGKPMPRDIQPRFSRVLVARLAVLTAFTLLALGAPPATEAASTPISSCRCLILLIEKTPMNG